MKMETLIDGLQFPTSVVFDPAGIAYVAESGVDEHGALAQGRVLRVDAEGRSSCIRDDLRAPINGLSYASLAGRPGLYVAEGGSPGRISHLGLDGTLTIVLDGLPGGGSYHTNMVVPGPDGWLYFGQAAMTNSGIIGDDEQRRAWPRRLPPDIPGMDVVLRGADVISEAIDGAPGSMAVTSAFAPFGERIAAGTRIPAQLPCTAALLRCRPDGSALERVAWGLRNAYGLGFTPDGRLLALDLGINDRGARPVAAAPSCLFEIESGAWYGWPDFTAGVSITDPRHVSTRGPIAQLLLANHDELPAPRAPLLRFPIHAAPVKFAIHPGPGLHAGHLFVALFGDKRPFTAPPGPAAGRAVARVDPRDWSLHPVVSAHLHRPIDVCFHPRTRALHVLDFGEYEVDATAQTHGIASSGRLCRVPDARDTALGRDPQA